ncbi:MAG: endonuclease domain-containing protein [Deltaproteobacteria bacterium]|nr:endonuclease domain-containing protein [Deltaproteobacteria bacterium]
MNPLTTPYNHSLLKEKRRTLRKDQTKAETILWHHLRHRQLNGIRFKRQYSVEFFIIDFYAPSLRLGIELDGGHHDNPEIRAQDQFRTTVLNNIDIQILRFWNSEIYENLKGVLEEIVRVCQPSSYLTLTSPRVGEG